jgi:hypothetical protein
MSRPPSPLFLTLTTSCYAYASLAPRLADSLCEKTALDCYAGRSLPNVAGLSRTSSTEPSWIRLYR